MDKKTIIMLKLKKEKIFCIGRNKTGTTSIEQVFKEFGYKVGSQAKAESLIHDYINGNWKPIIKYCRNAETFQDTPFSWPYTWLIMHEHFPKAKFILTVRDSEAWYQSQTRFHSKQFADGKRLPTKEDLMMAEYRYPGFIFDLITKVWKSPENDLYNKDRFIRNYERHNEDVRHFFKDKENFIEINVSDPDSYIKLCNFLGKDPIHDKFPHLNKS